MKNILVLFLFLFFSIESKAQDCTFVAFPDNLQSTNMFKCPGMFTHLTISVLPVDTPYLATLYMNGDTLEHGWYSPLNPQSPQTFSMDSLLYAGDYILHVEGYNGTNYQDTIFSFIDPNPISFTANVVAPISCVPGSLILENLQGGTAPYDLGILSGGVFDPIYTQQITSSSHTINGLSAGSYSITAQDDLGCLFSLGTIDPIIVPTGASSPQLSVDMTDNIEFCVQGGVAPYNFTWSDTSLSTFNNCIPLEVCWGEYIIIVEDDENCVDSSFVNIPETVGYIDPLTSSLIIDSEGVPPYSYAWYLNGDLLENENDLTLSFEMCPGFYEVVVTDNLNCSYVFELMIDELKSNLVEDVDCFDNQLITLEASAEGGTAPYSYLWSTGETSEIITNLSPQSYNLELTDHNGCVINKSLQIPLLTDSCLYNVFSPNGDLINDFWAINPSFLYEDSEVQIYNRWGKKVFDSIGYQDPWSGTNNSGKDLSEGVYFYIIFLNEDEDPLKGDVTLYR